MELDDVFFSQYPESEVLYYMDNCELVNISVCSAQSNKWRKSNIARQLKRRETGERYFIETDLQLDALKQILASRWSSTSNSSTILGDCARLLGRRMARWEGRAILHLFENSVKTKAENNTKLEPLPRWIIPLQSFESLLNLLACGLDLKCRNLRRQNFLTDLLTQFQDPNLRTEYEYFIRQQDIRDLLGILLQHGLRFITRNCNLLLQFFAAIYTSICEKEVSPITVEIVKMLVESTDEVKPKGKKERVIERLLSFIGRLENPVYMFLKIFEKNPNQSGIEILRLLVDNGYFSHEGALHFICYARTFNMCFHSDEALESILIASRQLHRRLCKDYKRFIEKHDGRFWTIYNISFRLFSFFSMKRVTILDFFRCISMLDCPNVPIPDTLRRALLESCRNCVEESLPNIIRVICAEIDINSMKECKTSDLDCEGNNALLLLSKNPLRRGKIIRESICVLIEQGIDVTYINGQGYNALVMFLVSDGVTSSNSCCEYGNWIESKDTAYWDTLSLLVKAGCKIDLNQEFGKGMLYKALTKFSYSSCCSKCAIAMPIHVTARRENFDHFANFFTELLVCGITSDGSEESYKSLAMYACDNYRGSEKAALQAVISNLWD